MKLKSKTPFNTDHLETVPPPDGVVAINVKFVHVFVLEMYNEISLEQ